MVIDLQTAGWPPVQLPYLASLHCSAITCSHHVSNIPLKLWERIIAAGSRQNSHFSTMVGSALAPSPLLPWAQFSWTSCSLLGVAYRWWHQPGPTATPEGPAAHRVGDFSGYFPFSKGDMIGGRGTLAESPHQAGSAHRHEDGTVRFWDASGVCLRLLYKLSTVRVFLTDTDLSENLSAQGEDEWPPLRKVRPGA